MRFVLIGAVAALAGLFLLADEAHAQSLQCRQQITPDQREACAEGEVDDLDVEGIGGAPDEADAPLIADADAVLAGTIALERLEPIAGRNA